MMSNGPARRAGRSKAARAGSTPPRLRLDSRHGPERNPRSPARGATGEAARPGVGRPRRRGMRSARSRLRPTHRLRQIEQPGAYGPRAWLFSRRANSNQTDARPRRRNWSRDHRSAAVEPGACGPGNSEHLERHPAWLPGSVSFIIGDQDAAPITTDRISVGRIRAATVRLAEPLARSGATRKSRGSSAPCEDRNLVGGPSSDRPSPIAVEAGRRSSSGRRRLPPGNGTRREH